MLSHKSTDPLAATGALLSLLMLAGCGAGVDVPAPAQQASTEYAAASDTSETGVSSAGPAPTAIETIQLAPVYTPLIAATINATPYWPVWFGTGKPVDGVNCLVNGNYHKHALISIYKNGKRLGFPDGIGRVHAGCYHAYEMHTHDVTGIIHMEADVPKQFKLGQWFSLWQQPLSRNGAAGLAGPVRFYIIENGSIKRYDGDPVQIPLLPHREVLIISGTTMTTVPKYQWPPGV
ncbi:hypothetical protein [Massilia sp. CF038]|uniref:hypothetical protein n=1 Tax=Massilia sp. CF038 TaxID=1881045 RepID=UPI000910C28B|nr:hypothetical protein [Massilia sp. CF038]SHG73484.1 hypothetical protein SAMN05428948_1815 [Massilia sp. CF038]